MDINFQTISIILVNLAIAAITSWITVRLSIKQFHSQRWWEKKVDAYTQILSNIYNIKHTADLRLQEIEGAIIISKEKNAKLTKSFSYGFDEIERLANLGAFIFSKEVSESLSDLQIELLKVEEVEEYPAMKEYFKITSKYLKKISEIARKDLKITDNI